MKNIQGKEEGLKLFNENGVMVYEFYKSSLRKFTWERTYDSNSNELIYKDSDGYSTEYTYDSNGNELTFKDSYGYSCEYTRDSNGNELTFKDSDEYSCEYTRDSNGKELTFKDSHGLRIGFDIPEYTMEELIKKLGNFKLVK